jgi:hypothetical protein
MCSTNRDATSAILVDRHGYMSHIQGMFARIEDSGHEFDRTVSAYWTTDTAEFVGAKLRDKEAYSNQLRERFAAELKEPERG